MDSAFSLANKVCHAKDCRKILIQGGIHMGIPFAKASIGKGLYATFCAKCYDEHMVKNNVQRTGEETV